MNATAKHSGANQLANLQHPLAASVAALFAMSPTSVGANTVFISNCNDAGGGSLRQAVTPAVANSGDTIDLSICAGSTISLKTGEIKITQTNLTLHAPTAGVTVKYTGPNHQRVFNHTGTGTLRLENLAVAGGYVYAAGGATVKGGCIYSKGSVYLSHSEVTDCKAIATGMFSAAVGGGIYSTSKLTARDSVISNNQIHAFVSSGAGAYAKGDISLFHSTITGNTGKGDSHGGGLHSSGNAVIAYSTVSGNYADTTGGGLEVSTGSLTLANSTVSGNSSFIVGGVYTNNATVTVQNSTIAFNTALTGKVGAEYVSPGLAVQTFSRNLSVVLQSSILSNNTYGATENDFSTEPMSGHTITTTGANNLIRTAFASLPTTGLITGACPLLGALRNNGGPTLTHALLSHSPAIDAGNNTSNVPGASQPALADQRELPYSRVSGPSGSPTPRADIGAYEVQQNDVLFNTDFEGCP